jgi:hypothetical protein
VISGPCSLPFFPPFLFPCTVVYGFWPQDRFTAGPVGWRASVLCSLFSVCFCVPTLRSPAFTAMGIGRNNLDFLFLGHGVIWPVTLAFVWRHEWRAKHTSLHFIIPHSCLSMFSVLFLVARFFFIVGQIPNTRAHRDSTVPQLK